jgi:hypothetical protein
MAARSRHLVSRVLEMPLSRLGAGAGVVALATSGLFGGLDQVDVPTAPTVAVNAVDTGDPWNVTVTGARVLDDLSPLRPTNPGDRWVALLATVEVTADESRDDLQDAVRLPGVDGLLKEKPEYVYLVRDNTTGPYLNPGMPEKLAFVWEQKASAAVPTEVTAEIWGKTQRPSSLTGNMQWFDDDAPRAEVAKVPVTDRRKKK